MTSRRLFLVLILTAVVADWGVERVQAAKLTLEFKPPATPASKPDGPGDVAGWGALVLMFTGPVTSAQYLIEDSPCPNFMDVPNFMGPTDTITIVPPPPFEGAPGYRIPVGKTVQVMVMSDQEVMLKSGAGSPPTPSFWRYKGNNADMRNKPASAVPEPAAMILVATSAALFALCRRRR